MTAITKSPSPLLIAGAAFIAAPAIVLALGSIPKVFGNTLRPGLVTLCRQVEANRTAALEMLRLSLLAIACSAAGLGLAYRFPRLHGDRNEGTGQAARKDR